MIMETDTSLGWKLKYLISFHPVQIEFELNVLNALLQVYLTGNIELYFNYTVKYISLYYLSLLALIDKLQNLNLLANSKPVLS